MQKALKIGGSLVLTMVVLLLTLFAVAVYVVDDQFYLEIVQEAVKDSTGQTLDISGHFEVERSLRPGLVAGDVRLSNDDMEPPAQIATVKQLHFRIELLPLLKGDLRFVVVMEQPQIRLNVDASGRGNWQQAEAKQAPTDSGDIGNDFNLDIGRVEIFDGLVTYRDARVDSSVELEIRSLELNHDRAEGLATLEFHGSYQGDDYSVHGSMRAPAHDTPLQAEWVIDGYAADASAVQNARPILHATASGTVSRLNQEPAFDLAVDGRLQNLVRLAENLRVNPGEWTQLGPVTAAARVQLEHGVYHVKDIDAALDPQGLIIHSKGSALHLNLDPDINLQLSMKTEDLSQLAQFKQVVPGYSLVGGGTMSAQARLVGTHGSYHLEGIEVQMDQKDLQLSLHGVVTNLEQEPAADLEGSLKVARLRTLSRFPDIPTSYLPRAGKAKAEFRVAIADGTVHLPDLHVTLTADGLSLVARGSMSELGSSNELDLELTGTAEMLSKLSQIAALSKPSFPDIGPAQASGWLRGSRGIYRIDKLQTRLNAKDLELKAAGTVSMLGDQPQARLDVTTRIRDLSRIPKIFGFDVSLPPVGPIQAKGVVESGKGKYHIRQFNARWQLPGLRASVTGKVASVMEAPELGMQLELKADTLDALSVVTQQELPPIGPFSLKSKLALDPHQYRMTELDVQLGSSDLSGQVLWSREEASPRLTAILSSRLLDLDELMTATIPPDGDAGRTKDKLTKSDPQASVASSSSNPDIEEGPWLSTEPLNLSWLHTWNGLIDAQFDRMVMDGETLDDVVSQAQLENGKLRIPVTRWRLKDGRSSSTAVINVRQSPPTFYYRHESKNIGISRMLLLPEGVIIGGKTSGITELTSSGWTLAEIFSGLNGKLLLEMGQARIVESGLAMVSGDVLGGMLRSISQSSDNQLYTEYECGVFGIDFKDGIATMDRSIALQSKRFNVGGGGQVDLKKGTLHLEMRPRARKGLGISASMLTGGFKISGKLNAAQAGLSMKGLVESYLLNSTAAWLLVNSPGGEVAASAVLVTRGIWDRITAGTFSCENTLKRIKRSRLQEGDK